MSKPLIGGTALATVIATPLAAAPHLPTPALAVVTLCLALIALGYVKVFSEGF